MAKYREASCRLCRREGEKLFLKGSRCSTSKCAVEKRPYAPGQHGQRRIKLSDYGVHLRAKQKLRRVYGMGEKQFRGVFEKADRMKGATGENLLQLLEMRLDNVIFQLGLASTRTQARQLVSHGHIQVNGHKVDISSYRVEVNDVVGVKEKSRELTIIKETLEKANVRTCPEWLKYNVETMAGRVERLPKRGDITIPVNEQLIVEFYSR